MPELRAGGPQCLCSACGRYFTRESTFAAHWQGDRVKGKRARALEHCRDPAAVGLVLNSDGFWASPPPKNPYWEKHKQQATEVLTQPTLI